MPRNRNSILDLLSLRGIDIDNYKWIYKGCNLIPEHIKSKFEKKDLVFKGKKDGVKIYEMHLNFKIKK